MSINPCPHPTTTAKKKDITVKYRVKFGIFWVLAAVLTGGCAILVWLCLPRRNRVIGVDRWIECTVCGAPVG